MLEKIGNYLSDTSRFFFFFSLCLGVTFLAIYQTFSHIISMKNLQKEYISLEKTVLSSIKYRKRKRDFQQQYALSSPNYLENFLREKDLLISEKKNLDYLASHPAYFLSPSLQSARIKWEKNTFSLYKEEGKEKDNIRESYFALKHPVLCSKQDLLEIIATLDNRKINSYIPKKQAPQFLIYDLEISQFSKESFLTFKLLQREYLKKP